VLCCKWGRVSDGSVKGGSRRSGSLCSLVTCQRSRWREGERESAREAESCNNESDALRIDNPLKFGPRRLSFNGAKAVQQRKSSAVERQQEQQQRKASSHRERGVAERLRRLSSLPLVVAPPPLHTTDKQLCCASSTHLSAVLIFPEAPAAFLNLRPPPHLSAFPHCQLPPPKPRVHLSDLIMAHTKLLPLAVLPIVRCDRPSPSSIAC
jgi:hypothetical protein